ncbi:MAG: hypothetical protein KVP17_004915 [Porospora cf. gigantea B]|uniref:uncharacterized protein n=1 Tax=Porospora cf. gigantea B TaxID=2853592 RepID=UPI0035719745|nr:MAG: hypothetical protein KVP17_004915 [Porospora cf. gigantea B]
MQRAVRPPVDPKALPIRSVKVKIRTKELTPRLTPMDSLLNSDSVFSEDAVRIDRVPRPPPRAQSTMVVDRITVSPPDHPTRSVRHLDASELEVKQSWNRSTRRGISIALTDSPRTKEDAATKPQFQPGPGYIFDKPAENFFKPFLEDPPAKRVLTGPTTSTGGSLGRLLDNEPWLEACRLFDLTRGSISSITRPSLGLPPDLLSLNGILRIPQFDVIKNPTL